MTDAPIFDSLKRRYGVYRYPRVRGLGEVKRPPTYIVLLKTQPKG